MNIVLIFNGLGNQMSQYAYYLAKKKKFPFSYFAFYTNKGNDHYGYELNRAFGISYIKYVNKLFIKLYFYGQKDHKIINRLLKRIINYHKEPKNYDYSCELLNKNTFGVDFYWGGWHSEKNFELIKEEIRRAFSFHIGGMPKESQEMDNIIISDNKSVSLHVRRGDYVNIPRESYYQFNDVASIPYYMAAISFIRKKIEHPNFYVFSDDIEWCKKVFVEDKFVYVESNKGEDSLFDMYLMSKCHHHINANSSFSWWGAWLGEHNDSIIVVPEFFIREVKTKDIYPERWIKISNEGVVINPN